MPWTSGVLNANVIIVLITMLCPISYIFAGIIYMTFLYSEKPDCIVLQHKDLLMEERFITTAGDVS